MSTQEQSFDIGEQIIENKSLNNLGSEKELQIWLKNSMEEEGWGVEREVNPDGSKYRVDLLCSHPTYGRVGIETKYITSSVSGKSMARATRQITEQYWDKEYNGDEVLLWAVCPYFDYDNELNRVYRSFFSQYGIGYLELKEEYSSVIDFYYGNREYKIPAFSNKYSMDNRYYDDVNIGKLKGFVEERREFDTSNY